MNKFHYYYYYYYYIITIINDVYIALSLQVAMQLRSCATNALNHRISYVMSNSFQFVPEHSLF